MEKYMLCTDLFVGIGNLLVFIVTGWLAKLTIRAVQGEEHRHEEATLFEANRHEEAMRLVELQARLAPLPTIPPATDTPTAPTTDDTGTAAA
jgi:hypothetical protein